jgi:hypothetical protein
MTYGKNVQIVFFAHSTSHSTTTSIASCVRGTVESRDFYFLTFYFCLKNLDF